MDPRSLRVGTHEVGACPGSACEREPHGEHGLARSGLTGEDREPLGQLEIEVPDDSETADVELAEHRRILAGTTDIADRRRDRGGRLTGVPRKVELVSNPRQEARRIITTNEASGSARRVDLDLGAYRDLLGLPTVRRDQPGLVADHLEAHHTPRPEHE